MHRFAERRRVFGTVAAQYAAARPGYPPQIIGSVLRYAGLGAGARALELGAGTGQATAQFAAAGITVLAVEPEAEMVAVLRERLGQEIHHGRVDTLVVDAEHAHLPAGEFDLVYSATAWHWLSEGVRWQLAMRALRAGGTLAAIWNFPLWQRIALRAPLLAAYQNSGVKLDEIGFMVESEPSAKALAREFIADADPEFDLQRIGHSEHRWSQRYRASEYVSLINTYADHIVLEPELREQLAAQITEVINRAGGSIELPYVTYALAVHKP